MPSGSEFQPLYWRPALAISILAGSVLAALAVYLLFLHKKHSNSPLAQNLIPDDEPKRKEKNAGQQPRGAKKRRLLPRLMFARRRMRRLVQSAEKTAQRLSLSGRGTGSLRWPWLSRFFWSTSRPGTADSSGTTTFTC